MRLIIIGTPGTGKTTLGKKLCAEKGLDYYSFTKLINKNNIQESKLEEEVILDEEKTKKFLNKFFKDKNNFLLDGFLAFWLDKEYVDVCIVLETNLNILKKRLEQKKYSNQKVKDNIEAESFQYLKIEAQENNHNIKLIKTNNKLAENYKKIKQAIK
jgi:adenylate kinase